MIINKPNYTTACSHGNGGMATEFSPDPEVEVVADNNSRHANSTLSALTSDTNKLFINLFTTLFKWFLGVLLTHVFFQSGKLIRH